MRLSPTPVRSWLPTGAADDPRTLFSLFAFLVAAGLEDEAAALYPAIDSFEAGPAAGTAVFPARAGSWPGHVPPAGPRPVPPGGWPRISVVMPSYNSGAYIEETIQSVLAQDYPELEWILLDNCSDDATPEVLARYRSRLPAVTVAPDAGQSDALNRGLARATGELVTWLNADDLYAPGALRRTAWSHRLHGWDVGVGGCLVHQDGRLLRHAAPGRAAPFFDLETLADLDRYFAVGHYFYQPELFFSRRLLAAAGPFVRPELHYVMDHELWLRLAALRPRVGRIDWPVALFRHHAGQKTADHDATHAELIRLLAPWRRPDPDPARRLLPALAALARHPAPVVELVFAGPTPPWFAALAAALAAWSRPVTLVAAGTGPGPSPGPGPDLRLFVVDDPADLPDRPDLPGLPAASPLACVCFLGRGGFKALYRARQRFDRRYYADPRAVDLFGPGPADAALPQSAGSDPAGQLAAVLAQLLGLAA